MITSLLWGELTNRWEDTKGIAGQHNDIRRLTVGQARNLGIGDEFDRVRATCIFSDANIIIVGDAGDRIVDDVFKNTAETDCVVDFWFLLSGEIDALGITTSFDVEYSTVRPDVLVITDEETVGISRERGLSSSGETEEKSDITLVLAYVGRRVKRELTEFDWLKIVLRET